MRELNPKVDEFIINAKKWHKEYQLLRQIVLDTELTEEVKWGVPCYSYNNGNVLLIHGFKDYCAILFVKGSLLKDPKNLLIQQTEYVQAARQIRFKSVDEINQLAPSIKEYILQAIEIEKAGLKVAFKTVEETEFCEEFQAKLDESPELKTAFEKLTPGRRKAYNYYFSSAKQSLTRISRVEKYIPKILEGKGMDD